MTSFRYICRLCGDVIESKTEDGIVNVAQAHYANQHGLQHGTDVEPTGIEVDVQAIKERIEEIRE